MKKHQEHILAIPAERVSFTGPELRLVDYDIKPADIILAQRAMLESNEAYRQVIPYTVLRCNNKYAAYRRTPKGNEARLHGMVSIGFGGHVDLADVVFDACSSMINIEETLRLAAEREIREELVINPGVSIISQEVLSGKIVSNMTPVDRVHMGLVTVIEIDSEEISAGESQIDFIGFHTSSDILAMAPLEAWSGGLLAALEEQQPEAALV